MSEHNEEFKLIVNKDEKHWLAQFIDGREIKQLAGSPTDYVVNQIVPGPGEDPEIGNDQKVDLSLKAPPEGMKRFTTRKPTTSPGQ